MRRFIAVVWLVIGVGTTVGVASVSAAPVTNSQVLGQAENTCQYYVSYALPDGLTEQAAPGVAGGSSFYGNGDANLSGWQMASSEVQSVGATISWVAQYKTNGPYQHAGFGHNQFADTKAAIFSTQAGGKLFAYANGLTVDLGVQYLEFFHAYKIVWRATDFQFFIDDIEVATLPNDWTNGFPLTPLWSDGLVDNAVFSLGSMEVSPCTAPPPSSTTTTTTAPGETTTTTSAGESTTTTSAGTTGTTSPPDGPDREISDADWKSLFEMVGVSLITAIVAAKGLGLLRAVLRFPT